MYNVVKIQGGKSYVINSGLPARVALELASIMRMQNTDAGTTYQVQKGV